MGQLERSLARDASGQAENENEELLVSPGRADSDSPEAPDDEKDLRPTELVTEDAAFEDEADDDAYDLGFAIGKMRITDRLGGLFRPRLVEEVCWQRYDILWYSNLPYSPATNSFLRPSAAFASQSEMR